VLKLDLINRIRELNKDVYGFHMPGHKRNTDKFGNDFPFDLDVTEIGEFDNIYHATGILKESEDIASKVYGADETHYLVNGSTVGILSSILGNTEEGDEILICYGCHKSVYNACELGKLKVRYLIPSIVGLNPQNLSLCKSADFEITPDLVYEKLEEFPSCKTVVIVSPTYEGIVSDIQGISKVCHKRGAVLIVDEAHGSHFGFHPYFPKNSNQLGADIVIHSLHKTMPALTGCSLLHFNGKLVNREKTLKYLGMFQTSSPSYVFMANIDYVVRMLDNLEQRERLFSEYVDILSNLRKQIKEIEGFTLLEAGEDVASSYVHYDRAKILINADSLGLDGMKLSKILDEKYNLLFELSTKEFILGMTSIGDTKEGFDRLIIALKEIAGSKLNTKNQEISSKVELGNINNTLHNIDDSNNITDDKEFSQKAKIKKEFVDIPYNIKTTDISLDDSLNKVSGKTIFAYPPGSPILVRGERISGNVLDTIEWSLANGVTLEGMTGDKISVVD
jgi:arginine/lysine/ornithine decarboxylase